MREVTCCISISFSVCDRKDVIALGRGRSLDMLLLLLLLLERLVALGHTQRQLEMPSGSFIQSTN